MNRFSQFEIDELRELDNILTEAMEMRDRHYGESQLVSGLLVEVEQALAEKG
jgi:hypothetical protein